MQHRFRGIAQLVEQRSPKPRAVSSRLTTPAITHRFFGACAFCFLPDNLNAGQAFPLGGKVFSAVFPHFLQISEIYA